MRSKLSANFENQYHDPTEYRHLASTLQYLTFTRSDICYAVQPVYLFMHDPHTHHILALKCIIRYVKITLDFGLHLSPSSIHNLLSYIDADWGGYPDTRSSTLGFCVYLSNNLISWYAKQQPTLSRSSVEAKYQ